MAIVFLFMLSFVSVAVLVPRVRLWALRSGFVDRPGGRKIHEDSVPPIGGIVVFPVFVGLFAAFLYRAGALTGEVLWFFAALALLVVTGAVDDRRGVAPRVKFLIQMIAAFLIAVLAGAHVPDLGDLFGLGVFELGFMTLPFALIATVLLINAVNLMDGLDGLAGGKGVIMLAGLWVAGLVSGYGPGVLGGGVLILMAALGGFLLYNLRSPWRARASVFLGDAGSLALGASLAWFSLSMARPDSAGIAPISVAWLLALPIYDICGQFARRMMEGRHPFDADAHHFHHHFVNAGVPVGRATAAILALTVLCGAIGVGGVALGVPLPVLTVLWIAGLLSHIYMSLRPQRMRRLIRALGGKRAKDG